MKSIKAKFTIIFGVLLLIFIGSGMMSILNMGNITNHFKDIHEKDKPRLDAMRNLLSHIIDMETGQRGYKLTKDKIFLEPYMEGKTAFDNDYADLVKRLHENIKNKYGNSPEALACREFGYIAKLTEVDDLINSWKHQIVCLGNSEYNGKYTIDKTRILLNSIIKEESDCINKEYKKALKIERVAQNIFIVISIGALFVIVGIILYISKAIIVPIKKLIEGTEQIGAGNLTHRTNIDRKDELGALSKSFNHMTKQWQDSQDSLEVFKDYAERSVQGMGWADLNGKVIYANKALRDLLNDDAQNTCGTPILDFYSKEEKQRLTDEVFPTVMEKGQWTGELELNGKITTNDLILMRDKKGKPLYFSNLVTDVTEQKKYETTLKEEKNKSELLAKEAQTANVAKSEFLASMSHEIRTPMNSIIALSELMKSDDMSEEHHQWIEVINGAGVSLLNLINDILDFSKIEAGKLQIENVPCDPEDIMESVEMLAPQAKAKGIELNISYDLPRTILADPTRIRQCLVNLVGNAIKFTKEGSVDFVASCNNDIIKFIIADTGIGIKEEQRKTILEPFSQADASTTRNFGGTGLGLSITKKLIDLMGGKLHISSTWGVGSTFEVTIPVNAIDKQVITKRPEIDRSEKLCGHILVAEDDKRNQVAISATLKKMGLTYKMVDNGKEAVSEYMLNKKQYNLILMDMMMPVMSGYDASKILKQQNCEIPIVALTASAMKGDMEKCINAGCDDYVAKPITFNSIYDRLNENLLIPIKVSH